MRRHGVGAPVACLGDRRRRVLPHPPVLVPEWRSGAAVELDDLRAACRTAIDARRRGRAAGRARVR